jgi:phage tail tape measure protein, TP901 family, core region
MADELGSKLGFDVSDAIASLRALKREFENYSDSLLKSAGDASKFNKEQEAIDKLLISAAAAAESAAKGLKAYVAAEGQAGAATTRLTRQVDELIGRYNRLSIAATQAGASAGRGGLAGAGPLSGFVQDRSNKIAAEAAQIQARSDQAAIAAFNQKVAFEQKLVDFENQKRKIQFRAGDNAVREAFGKPSIPLGSTFADEQKKSQSAMNEIGISYRGLLKIFATQIAFKALGSFIQAAKEGTAEAIKFETQLGQIQTISEEFTTRGLNATADAVRELSDRFGQPIEDVAAGLYETLSNQVGNATESIGFLNTALTFSKGAVTTTADAVDLLSGIMNAYGFTAASAANISDQLFVTIDRGRVKGSELANTFGRVAPLAAQLGIDLTEVNTALAELTIQGVKPNDALTQLTNVMLKLAKPSEALKEVFNQMGVASAEAGIAIFGFDGFLREIGKTTDGSVTELGKLFNQIRGTRGVIGIISRDNEKYAETLREIQTASRETSRSIEAANKVLSTPGQQLTIELNKARNFLINDFGRSAITVFNAFTQNVVSAKNALIIFGSAITAVGTVLGAGGIIILIAQVGSGLKFLQAQFVGTGVTAEVAAGRVAIFNAAITTTAFLLGGAALALGAVAAIRTVFDQGKNVEAANDAIRVHNDLLAESVRKEVQALEEPIAARKEAVTQQIAAITGYFAKVNRLANTDKENAFKLQTDITGNFKDQLDKRESLLTSFLNKLEQTQKNSAANIAKIGESGREQQFQENSNRFERDLKGTTPEQAASLLAARIQKVMRAAKQAFAEGSTQGNEFGNQLLKEAFTLANRVADQDATRARGEGLINQLLREQQNIQGQLVAQEQAKAAAAAKTETETKGVILETKSKIDEFNKLQETLQKGLKPGSTDPLTDEQISKIKSRLIELGGEIQTNLQKVGTANIPKILGLQDIQRQLLEPFIDPFTKQLTSLNSAAQSAMTQVIATLNKTAASLPVEIKILFKGLTGKDATGLTLGEGQNAAAALGTKLKQNIENEKALPGLTAGVGAAQKALDSFVNSAVTTANTAGFLSQSLGKDIVEFLSFQKVGEAGKQRVDDFNASLRELQNKGVKAALSGDTETLNAVVQEFLALAKTSKDAQASLAKNGQVDITAPLLGGPSDLGTAKAFGDAFANAAQQLLLLAEARAKEQAAREKAGKNAQLEGALSTGDSTTLLLLQTIDSIQQKNAEAGAAFGKSFEGSTITADAAASTFLDDVKTKAGEAGAQFGVSFTAGFDQALANAKAQLSTAAPTVQGKSRGGLIHYFANGGFVPRGTDTIPAMLSKGEFVVNAASSRKFYADLVAINAGVRPVYRAEGGSVSNITNVGDIVVNVPGTRSGRVSGRELAKDLRRELRRGTIHR